MRKTWLVLALFAGGCGLDQPLLPQCEADKAPTGTGLGKVLRKTSEVADENRRRGIDIVFVSEGFEETQLDDYRVRVAGWIEGMRGDPNGMVAHDPTLFNFHRLDVPGSNLAACLRAESSEFSGLRMFNVDPIAVGYGALATANADVVVVVINADVGRANAAFPALTLDDPPGVVRIGRNETHQVVAHELGHAVLGLGDEYIETTAAWPSQGTWLGDGLPAYRNLSVSPNPAKFAGLGSAPGGMRYATGIFHPDATCRMGATELGFSPDFCAACRAQMKQILDARKGVQDGEPRWGVIPRNLGNASVEVAAADWNGLKSMSLTIAGATPMKFDFAGPNQANGWFTLGKAMPGEQVLVTIDVEDTLGSAVHFDTTITVPPAPDAGPR